MEEKFGLEKGFSSMKKTIMLLLCLILITGLCGTAFAEVKPQGVPQVYPLTIDEEIASKAEPVPEICFTSFASENGLEGRIYYLIGKVIRTEDKQTDKGTLHYVFLQTEYGYAGILDYYSFSIDAFTLGIMPSDQIGLFEEPGTDYSFPAIGEFVKTIVIYSGYSDEYEMPLFYYGTPKGLLGYYNTLDHATNPDEITLGDELPTSAMVEEEIAGLQYHIPADWSKEGETSDQVYYYPPTESITMLYIMVRDINTYSDTLYPAMKASIISGMKKSAKGYEELDCDDTEIAGHKGFTVVFKSKTSGTDIICTAYMVIANNKVYAFMFTSDANGDEDVNRAFLEQGAAIIESLSFKETTVLNEDEGELEPSYTPTTGESNALRKANSYLEYSAFSYSGLIDQLEYSGFSHEEAVYAANNCGADWFAQAVKKAESYLKYSAFSRTRLIEQLEYSGFTHEQAVYGAEQNGY